MSAVAFCTVATLLMGSVAWAEESVPVPGTCTVAGNPCVDNCQDNLSGRLAGCDRRYQSRLAECQNRPSPEVCEDRAWGNYQSCQDNAWTNYYACLDTCIV